MLNCAVVTYRDEVFCHSSPPHGSHSIGSRPWALKLSRPGSLIIVDNVIRKGSLLEKESNDPAVQGMRKFIELLGREPRFQATVIQTVGSKGYDGFAIAVVR